MISFQHRASVWQPALAQPTTSKARRPDRRGWAAGRIFRPDTANNSPLAEARRPFEGDRTSDEARPCLAARVLSASVTSSGT